METHKLKPDDVLVYKKGGKYYHKRTITRVTKTQAIAEKTEGVTDRIITYKFSILADVNNGIITAHPIQFHKRGFGTYVLLTPEIEKDVNSSLKKEEMLSLINTFNYTVLNNKQLEKLVLFLQKL